MRVLVAEDDQVIADFVSQASFIPAMRNGVPEKGVVKMTFR